MKRLSLLSLALAGVLGLALNANVLADTSSTASATADNAQQTGSDSWITTKVKTKLAGASDVQASSINVQTNNGVVTLSGVVNSATGAMKAIKLTSETEGVKSVSFSDLSIKDSSSSAQDAYITSKVKWTLAVDAISTADGNTIRVTTRAGKVFLKGHVINQNTKDSAEQAAAGVAGVTSVKNDLKIKKPS